MQDFNVVTSFESISDGKFMIIYIQVGDYCFPQKNWTDLGIYLIDGWSQELLKLLKNEEKIISCSFMDGAYRFDVCKIDENNWKLSCIEEYADETEKILYESNVKPNQATKAVLEKLKSLIRMYKEKNDHKSSLYFQKYEQELLILTST
jgi:hypothetical protein